MNIGNATRTYRYTYVHLLYRATTGGLSSHLLKENIDRVSVEQEEPDSPIFEHGFDQEIANDIMKLFMNANYYFYKYIDSETKKIGPIVEEIESILGDISPLKDLLVETKLEPLYGKNEDGEANYENKIGEREFKYLVTSNLNMAKGIFTKVLRTNIKKTMQDVDLFISTIT